SDGSGATAEFTQWMLATQPSYWKNYCALPDINRAPCTQTSAYPVLPGSNMVAQAGDNGISGYIRQPQANGSIGYVEYSFAKITGFPVAKVLNAAGYYTEPTAGHVAVSLLKAQVRGCNATTGVCSNPNNDPLYLTQDLSNVYTDKDPRTYELSGYSYMILPTDLTVPQFTSAKGNSLGAFGNYLLCQGQAPLDNLGYSSLPINLVLAGFKQLQRIPGNTVPTQTTTDIEGCHNPTFDPNDTLGHNKLAETDPNPQPCDKQGPTQCTTPTGGAKTSTPVKASALGPGQSQSGGNGSGAASGATGAAGGTTAEGGAPVPQNCNPDTGNCNQAALIGGSGTGGANVNAIPTSASASLGDGLEVALMALASALLLCLVVLPPVITQVNRRRRQRRLPGVPGAFP
ncbi:MAG: substrate-binding domain-containing protein, partial [Actinobacteria bacterium]|nr:substrate-binding domain-containing protein [Actinomycetota bacterium]